MAFGADGRIYAGTDPALGNNLIDVIDPATGIATEYLQEGVWQTSRHADLGSCAMPKADLVVSKTAETTKPAVEDGDVITYTVRVRNVGSAPATSATLKDLIPANTTYVPGSTTLNNNAVPDVGGMAYRTTNMIEGSRTGVDALIPAGDTATVQFKVRVNAGTIANKVDTISNQATVTSSAGTVLSAAPARPTGTATAPDPTTTIVARSGVAITKTASTTTVTGTGTVTYTYKVTNTGVDPLASVALTDAATTTASGAAKPLPNSACASPTRTGGDANGDGLLDPTETWTYTCAQPLTWTAGSPDPTTVANTATVTARGDITTKAVTANASGQLHRARDEHRRHPAGVHADRHPGLRLDDRHRRCDVNRPGRRIGHQRRPVDPRHRHRRRRDEPRVRLHRDVPLHRYHHGCGGRPAQHRCSG